MSQKLLSRLVLLVSCVVVLSGCTSLKDRIQGTTPTPSDTTTQTYTSVQEIRDAQTDQEAVQVTTDEVDSALQAVDSLESTETLNTQDVGL